MPLLSNDVFLGSLQEKLESANLAAKAQAAVAAIAGGSPSPTPKPSSMPKDVSHCLCAVRAFQCRTPSPPGSIFLVTAFQAIGSARHPKVHCLEAP